MVSRVLRVLEDRHHCARRARHYRFPAGRIVVSIPFVRELEFEYGRADEAQPGLRRVIANNPGAFTFYGTGTYIIGEGNVASGTGLPMRHTFAPLSKPPVVKPSRTLVTHTHNDHSPAVGLREYTDAPTYGYGPHGSGKAEEGIVIEEGSDMEFSPDVEVRDGDVIRGRRLVRRVCSHRATPQIIFAFPGVKLPHC